jgi:hypothetical protein
MSNDKGPADPNPNSNNGYRNTALKEPLPLRLWSQSEKVIEGSNNAFIVLGRDRPSDLNSGYGGIGDHKAGMIELCVGAFGSADASTLNGYVDPNVGADAAKIYISQKADIDDYFFLASGRSGKSVARSAIALKADDIRIIGRNTIKIISNCDAVLSNDEPSYSALGVQIIANNDDRTLEPMPKGLKLNSAFEQLCKNIIQIIGTVEKFMNIQRDFNYLVSQHTHYENFMVSPVPVSVSPTLATSGIDVILKLLKEVEADLRIETANFTSWENAYINPASTSTYINSTYNYVN